MEEEDGTTEGPCPFIVHGLTGDEFSTKTMKTIKATALQHLTSEGKILAIGHLCVGQKDMIDGTEEKGREVSISSNMELMVNKDKYVW
jgi:hypothetical protein